MFKLFNLEKFKSNYAFIYNGKKIRFSKVLSDIKRYNKRIKKIQLFLFFQKILTHQF